MMIQLKLQSQYTFVNLARLTKLGRHIFNKQNYLINQLTKKKASKHMSFSNRTSFVNQHQIQHPAQVSNHSYSPYGQRLPYQINSYSQMSSPFSQDYLPAQNRNPNLSNTRQNCQTNQIAPPPSNKYFPQEAYSINQINHRTGQSEHQQNLQSNQKIEQIDISTLISPLLLKAYNILRQCELKPDQLSKIETNLKEKLNTLKKYHKNFKLKMTDLLSVAEKKYENLNNMVNNSVKKDGHARSADHLTKKILRSIRPEDQNSDRKASKSCLRTPNTIKRTEKGKKEAKTNDNDK